MSASCWEARGSVAWVSASSFSEVLLSPQFVWFCDRER